MLLSPDDLHDLVTNLLQRHTAFAYVFESRHLVDEPLFKLDRVEMDFFHVDSFRNTADELVVPHASGNENIRKVTASELTTTI